MFVDVAPTMLNGYSNNIDNVYLDKRVGHGVFDDGGGMWEGMEGNSIQNKTEREREG